MKNTLSTPTHEFVRLFLDDQTSDHHETFTLDTPGESLNLVVIYCYKNHNKLDLSFTINHLAPDTHSQIYVSGLLSEYAQKTCHLTINFQKGAKGATGFEYENVFLLSDHAKNLSEPVINCAEKDVKGSHGAAIGHLDITQINYLVSRGIPPQRAKTLLVRSALFKPLNYISNAFLKNSVKNTLNRIQYNI